MLPMSEPIAMQSSPEKRSVVVPKTKEEDKEEIELGEDCMPKMAELIEGEEIRSSSINTWCRNVEMGARRFSERSRKKELQKKKKIEEERGGAASPET